MPTKKESDKLATEMRALRLTLEKVNTPARKFLTGLLAGVGSAVGATVVAALGFYALYKLIEASPLADSFLRFQ